MTLVLRHAAASGHRAEPAAGQVATTGATPLRQVSAMTSIRVRIRRRLWSPVEPPSCRVPWPAAIGAMFGGPVGVVGGALVGIGFGIAVDSGWNLFD